MDQRHLIFETFMFIPRPPEIQNIWILKYLLEVYIAWNPLLATDESVLYFTHNVLELDRIGGGITLPQYLPTSCPLGPISLTCKIFKTKLQGQIEGFW